jgi:hypothetical protein
MNEENKSGVIKGNRLLFDFIRRFAGLERGVVEGRGQLRVKS